MLTPARSRKAAVDSDQKCETDSPWIAFFWLSRVRKILVVCWKFLMGASDGRSRYPKKKMKYMSGRNWTVMRWIGYLVYSHDHR